VHHLTYAHVFNEFLFELMAVCDECHDRLHREDVPEADLVNEWQEAELCSGCRFAGEHEHRPYCHKFGAYIIEAVSPEGDCGPNRSGEEELR
jgi:hypothetical protein